MKPRIENLPPKKLVGRSLKMSLSADQTVDLWKRFMPLRKTIKGILGTEFYSMQIYDRVLNFHEFDAQTEFVKWAAVEVEAFPEREEELEQFTLEGGWYAVFIHKGPASKFPQTAAYIFGQWLPNSEYDLDDRPHFELLDENYRTKDPETAEEEVWIPIKKKEQ